MREVRGPEHEYTNVLDLIALHDRVKSHCQKIIDNPNHLLSSEASYPLGAMDGEIWERPEAFYVVQKLTPQLPHIRGALTAFFQGALETWERFTSEFASNGVIANASAAERSRAFMRSTNDYNEGSLGAFRVGMRHAPSMTLDSYNARAMYKRNDAGAFMKHTLEADDYTYIRKKARMIDGSGVEQSRRLTQVRADRDIVDEKRAKQVIRTEKKHAADAKLDALELRLDPMDVSNSPGSVVSIEAQLNWHRRDGNPDIPNKTAIKKLAKLAKVELLIAAIKCYNEGRPGDGEGAIKEEPALATEVEYDLESDDELYH
jgi:hypothetical protein